MSASVTKSDKNRMTTILPSLQVASRMYIQSNRVINMDQVSLGLEPNSAMLMPGNIHNPRPNNLFLFPSYIVIKKKFAR
jgi:hypothetical protein